MGAHFMIETIAKIENGEYDKVSGHYFLSALASGALKVEDEFFKHDIALGLARLAGKAGEDVGELALRGVHEIVRYGSGLVFSRELRQAVEAVAFDGKNEEICEKAGRILATINGRRTVALRCTL